MRMADHRLGNRIHTSLPLLHRQSRAKDGFRLYRPVHGQYDLRVLLCRRGHWKDDGRDQ